MRRWLVILLLSLCVIALPLTTRGQVLTGPCPQQILQYTPFQQEVLTMTNSAPIQLSAAHVANTTGSAVQMVAVSNSGPNAIIYTVNGNGPVIAVSGVGHHLAIGSQIFICGAHAASSIWFLAVAGSSSVYATYYRQR